MKKIIQYFVSVVVLLSLLANCSNNEKPIEPPAPDDSTSTINSWISFNSSDEWQMKTISGDSAYFQALDTAEISLATRFWDTASANRITMNAIPVQFIYWDGKMKKREYFAIGFNDSCYIFAAKKHPLTASYNLDFYVYLFSIPFEKPTSGYYEQDGVYLSYGQMNYLTEWNVINSYWNVTYYGVNSSITPPTYSTTFQFDSNGFYGYMNYSATK
jgi:hypothetical protein